MNFHRQKTNLEAPHANKFGGTSLRDRTVQDPLSWFTIEIVSKKSCPAEMLSLPVGANELQSEINDGVPS